MAFKPDYGRVTGKQEVIKMPRTCRATVVIDRGS
jgi:hypothetical protein